MLSSYHNGNDLYFKDLGCLVIRVNVPLGTPDWNYDNGIGIRNDKG
jgi:hypothetical protein